MKKSKAKLGFNCTKIHALSFPQNRLVHINPLFHIPHDRLKLNNLIYLFVVFLVEFRGDISYIGNEVRVTSETRRSRRPRRD